MTIDGRPTPEPSPHSSAAVALVVPDEAVHWLTGTDRQPPAATVLELNAGAGYLTEHLVRFGHRVIATDPSPQNLATLRSRVVPFAVGVSGAEAIPSPSQTVDVVVCHPSDGRIDPEKALAEINRVLRPGGAVAILWLSRDEGVPWVRRLGKLIGPEAEGHRLTSALRDTDQFTDVDETSWRTWQRMDRGGLIAYAQASGVSDEGTLAAVGALYDDYDRGPDGLQMPYLVRGLRAIVHHAPEAKPEQPDPAAGHLEAVEMEPAIVDPIDPPDEPGTLLIDFT
ncbi:MAG TPA: class I SAM-dependent methyltransferase [Marmoricola sp.]|nr:class I SAM-dependent methyltransferase [Marmoricola sp.]